VNSVNDANNAIYAAKAADAQARRVAKRAGYYAMKSRQRSKDFDHCGGFMLINPHTNTVIAGRRFNLNAQGGIAHCDGWWA
jgi:hypothetical protein